MRATFLGTADGHTSAKRSHSGIYLQNDSTSLLLDCGANVAQFLVQNKLSADHPESIWLSHLHSDHLGQFPMLIQSLWLRGRTTPLQVFAPKLALPTLRNYLEKCILFPGLIGFPIRWRPLSAGKKFSHGGLRLTAFPTAHLLALNKRFHTKYPQTCFECFGLILETGSDRIVYSADLASPHELRPHLQKPTRTLICELTHFPEKSLFTELSQAKPIKQTLITHYPDELMTKQRALRNLAVKCSFRSKIQLVKDGQTHLI